MRPAHVAFAPGAARRHARPRVATVAPWKLVAAASLWMAALPNLPLWSALAYLGVFAEASGWILAWGLAVAISAGVFAFVSVFSWRWTLKPLLVVLLVASSVAAHFMQAYGVVFDSTMLDNIVQTDLREAAALASPTLLAWVLLLGVVPAWLVVRTPVDFVRWPRQVARNAGAVAVALLVVVLSLLACFQPLASQMRNHKQLRYLITPLNMVYAAGVATAQPFLHRGARVAIGEDARRQAVAGARPPLLVLVVGETARSDHFGLNGYARDTTPRLAARGVASWRQAWSCGTNTATSLPCMFSHLGREGVGSAGAYENLLDVVQRAGLAVLWIDNQSGCKGVCDRVPHVVNSAELHPRHCKDGECLDAVLLEGLDEHIAALPEARRARGVVVVLHQMGSHGPAYSRRSPPEAKRFQPECTRADLQACDREALVNAYDNSIAYTDQVLASTIDWLDGRRQHYDAAMVYVSDHGESLGEHNLFLHGLPYAMAPDAQKHVAWITWLSPEVEQRSAMRMDCLRSLRDRPVSHDHFFHAVLGLLQVRSAVYRRDRDPYLACFG
ncbi:phosphoethanolamine--lipid A transferase [Ramlibacter sp. AW1]|uniref:Phosphoethanolamine--lipid A transferase n=1 Tax=Ramlibacter aurantiacus TaxID=2801330 RepID=A0A937D5U6_9BURK|nr:phosphoethanolamine--lipid A transferase [Ramlibacter aurantiacus]MBL0421672.1 phosphoethanolamine--lipid A transferase [Ramlibacter aurantiacus]